MRLIVLLIAAALSFNAQAAARCVDGSGAVVGYADTASACPAGSRFKGEVAPMPAAQASDVKSAQAQAAKDQTAVNVLDKARLKDERAAAQAQLSAQKHSASKAKSCKAAELVLKRAQGIYDDTAYDRSVSSSKASKKSDHHTSKRESNSTPAKQRRKAERNLALAQGKRDLACS